MPIIFDSEKRIFRLDTKESSYIMGIGELDVLTNFYYGTRVPDMDADFLRWREPFCSSFSPKLNGTRDGGFAPDMTPFEYPGTNMGDYRLTAVSVASAKGDTITDLRYVSHEIYPGKRGIEGLPATYVNSDDEATTLELTLRDSATGVEAILCYTVFENLSAMARSVRIVNGGTEAVDVKKVASACLNLPLGEYEMIYTYGKYAKERCVERAKIARQTQSIKSTRGSSGHNYTPFAAYARDGAGEEYGDVYGVCFVYSGNFSIDSEMDYFGATRVTVGINPEGFSWHLEPGETFNSPEAITVYSDAGLGKMSRIYHKLISKNLVRGKWRDAKRPLLINNWEATGMGISADLMEDFAREASKLGFEMLVMDDGWFGARNHDRAGLGDWKVNPDKFPRGLGDLVEKVNGFGMKFGIWYEPEMVNEDSDLYRAHPDWVLHAGNRPYSNARNQLMLDMTRKEVRDNIFDQMYAVLSAYNIEYVKWDMNRNFSEAFSNVLPADRYGELAHRYVLGVYDLMERLVTTFPHLLLESCSGGGGRYDAGILYYSPQVWTSDNTDGIDREFIQFGTSLCYPALSMGSHLSHNWRCHGRDGFATKGNVALWGSFGYELNPLNLTDEEREVTADMIEAYHKYYDLIHYGDLYRLEYPTDNPCRASWMFVSEDKSEAMLTVVLNMKPFVTTHLNRLRGLDPNKMYRIEGTDQVLSGALLMCGGYPTTAKEVFMGDKSSFIVHFIEEK